MTSPACRPRPTGVRQPGAIKHQEEKEPMNAKRRKEPYPHPDPQDIHVGARIRSRRMELKLSQTELADQLGLTFQQVQKYEKGVNRVGAGRLNTIAAFLKVGVPYFYEGIAGGNIDAQAGDALRTFATSRDGLAIVAAWEHLKPKFRSVFADMVRVAAEL